MKPFQDTHPGGPETLPFGSEAALPAQAAGSSSMRLLGVLLGGLFALMHGYVLVTHGAMDGMALTRQPDSDWLLPWHGLWFLLACLGWSPGTACRKTRPPACAGWRWPVC